MKTNKIKQIEKIKKGCGKLIDYTDLKYTKKDEIKICGVGWLCHECKAKLNEVLK